MRGKDRHATQGDLSEKRRRKLATDFLKETPQLFISTMRNAAQRRFDVTPDSLGRKRTRVSVIVSRPIRLRESAAPIRRVLIFDDHPATIRLLNDVDRAQKRENKLAIVEFSALIVLLLLAMFWPCNTLIQCSKPRSCSISTAPVAQGSALPSAREESAPVRY